MDNDTPATPHALSWADAILKTLAENGRPMDRHEILTHIHIQKLRPVTGNTPTQTISRILSTYVRHGKMIKRIEAGKYQLLHDNEPNASDENVRIQNIATRENILETEKDTLIKARIGQGHFRQMLAKYWGNACALTGFSQMEALRASHIIPWSQQTDATNSHRLDPENGLLLRADLDALFDRHLITFTDEGELVYSTLIPQADKTMLPPAGTVLRRKLNEKQQLYLREHRKRLKKSSNV